MGKKDYSNYTKEELIKEVESLKKQKTYGLVWEEDKTKENFDYYINWDGVKNKEVFKEAEKKFPVVKEIKSKEIKTNDNGEYNLLIEGDNYHSLAVLNFTHKKAIDVIYIDPPYNTGNKDFKYNDNWVEKEDTYRHSKWLSFMEKRLKLARELLKDTGIIFISIDDNEFAQLKILCDEVFGEQNFIANLIWKKKSGGGSDAKYFAIDHEYVLAYAKNEKFQERYYVALTNRLKADYKFKDSNYEKLGPYKRKNLYQTGIDTNRPNLKYKIKCPDGTFVSPPTIWRWSRETFENANNTGKIDFIKKRNGDWQIFTKMYLYDDNGDEYQIKPRSILLDVGLTKDGSKELKDIFHKKMFDYPKPTSLIEYLILTATKNKGVILDFFAGTGTTGHAILKINKANSKYRFILCTNNEDDICTNVCYPRLEKVINGYYDINKNKISGLEGNVKYFKNAFVDSKGTDKNKRKLVAKSTDMICIKESAFEKVLDKETFKIFKNNKNYLGIVFDEESISDFIKEVKKINGKFNVYVFSLDASVPEEEFKEVKDKVNLCPIPEVILHVYRRVFKND